MFAIEKGVPAPRTVRVAQTGRPSKYEFGRLAVGDSFLVGHAEAARVYAALRKWKQRTPGFDYRSAVEGSGVRMWRVA